MPPPSAQAPAEGGAQPTVAPGHIPTHDLDPAHEASHNRVRPRGGARFVSSYAVLVLLLGTGAFTPLVQFDTQNLVFALWSIAYLVAAFGLVDDLFRTRRAVTVPLPLAAFLALATASVLWSVAPDISLRRSVGLVGTAVVGLFLARHLRPVDLFDALRRAVLIVALASLLLYASGSPLAVDEVHGTLRGVVITKNTLGRLLALGILAAAAVFLLDRTRRRRSVNSGLVMIGALALTDSTGGMVLAAFVLALAAPMALVEHRRARLALVGLAALGLGVLCLLVPGTTPDDAAEAIGEDVTLTGRTDIWEQSLEAMSQRPVLGYGYGAFWHEDGAIEADQIRARLQWGVPNAHNGLLDVGLDLGAAGVTAAVAALGSLLVRGVTDLRNGSFQVGLFRLSIGVMTVLSNIAETGLFQQNTMYTVLLVAALAAGRRPAPKDVRGADTEAMSA